MSRAGEGRADERAGGEGRANKRAGGEGRADKRASRAGEERASERADMLYADEEATKRKLARTGVKINFLSGEANI